MENSYFDNQNGRSFGIDLLRSIAIFMVVVLHILKHSDALDTFQAGTLDHGVIWGMEAFAICAVNIFAIISGFLCSQQKFRISRIIRLWLEVLFYSVLFSLITGVIYHNFSYHNLISSFFPIVTKKYWYFTAYFMLMLLMPLFNNLIEAATKSTFRIFLFVLGVCFSLVHMKYDVWEIEGGYSWIWLSYLYFVGAYLKKYTLSVMSKKKLISIYISASILILCLYIFITYIKEHFGISIINAHSVYFYNCPLAVLQALALFQIFRHISIKGKMAVFIQYISSLSFGVYLSHSYFLSYFRKYIVICDFPTYMFIPLTFLYALAIYLASCIVEALRLKIFKLFHIDVATEKIGNFLTAFLFKSKYNTKTFRVENQ